MIEIINTHCPSCDKPLQVVWCNGVVCDQYHVLIADMVMCTECYDDMIMMQHRGVIALEGAGWS